jgi:major membrane immunogen (membrane-anchored lipoprotein)
MKRILTLTIAVLLVFAFAACGGASAYKDGTYTAESQPDEHGSSATLSITIADGKITAVDWKELSNGKEKGAEYGMTNGKIENQENYDKAQNALKISKTLGDKLIASQDVNKLDGVSGATGSTTTFKTLVEEALAKAKK